MNAGTIRTTVYFKSDESVKKLHLSLEMPREESETQYECTYRIAEEKGTTIERVAFGADEWQSLMIGVRHLFLEASQQYRSEVGDLYWENPRSEDAAQTDWSSVFGGLALDDQPED